jgi:large subunit ribosomal protein L10
MRRQVGGQARTRSTTGEAMSKTVKQMEMDALKQTFHDVRDMVVLSPKGVSCAMDHELRSNLRKKNIRLMMVKNTLTRRVFRDLGLKVADDSPYWAKPTWLAWGMDSAGSLGKELATVLADPKYKDKVTVKGGIAEGDVIDFEAMQRLPTLAEALGRIVALILGPGSQLAGQIVGPGGQLAGQVKSLGEEKKEEAAPPPAA